MTTPTAPTTPNPTAPLTAAKVRETFVQFFIEAHRHTMVASSPCVPHDDPTLLFANAGMNQFKPCFLGQVAPGSPLDGVTRATNSQKCIRAGGKHNDLDDVGKDTYHHTFFEMLGNWSFGDYFKQEAVEWAWQLLTGVYGLDPDRLYATYFGGDDAMGLPPDTEARDLWLKVLPEDRVLPGSTKDNFWEMGDTGPCGPCSELHHDGRSDAERASTPGRGLVNEDHPDLIEIWNLVFIQFDRQSGGTLKPLPAKHVDTGMGLERIVRVVQGKSSNYDTDLFTPLFEAIKSVSNAPRAYQGKLGAHDADGVDMAYRVIADHARTLTFAITDGAQPSNEGRGYVLRRILRRAVRFGRQKLDAPEGFLSKLVAVVAREMGEAFPELRKNPGHVAEIVLEEEQSFGKTLDRGIKQFEDATGSGQLVSGEDAFKLYDTYGFPLDLTQLMAEERGLEVDVEGFERCMAEQKARSRAGVKGGEDDPNRLDPDALAQLDSKGVKPTDDAHKYADRDITATVKAVWVNGRWVDRAKDGAGRQIGVVLDRTNYYAEAGGQVADTGTLTDPGDGDDGAAFRVDDVRAFGGHILHVGHLQRGDLRVGDTVQLHRDRARRSQTAANHTATHMLNFALRKTVGDHVDQKGSLVAPDKLRFDFANNGPVEAGALTEAETIVREWIERDEPVTAQLAPLFVAKGVTGLRAVFGERYPDPVRVVVVGEQAERVLDDPERDEWRRLSVEFCGGTHLERTGDAKAFALVGEEGIAKGVRRITALTGVPALAAIESAKALTARLSDLAAKAERMAPGDLEREAQDISGQIDEMTLPAPSKADLRGRLASLQETVKAAKKAAQRERAAEVSKLARSIADSAQTAGDRVIVASIEAGDDRQALQAALKTVQDVCKTSAVMLLSRADTAGDPGPVAIIAGVPKGLVGVGLKAGDWVRETATVMGGKGGGRPDQAQGGAPDGAKLSDAIQHARTWAMQKVM